LKRSRLDSFHHEEEDDEAHPLMASEQRGRVCSSGAMEVCGVGVLRELTEKEHEREMGNGGAREDWRSRWLGFGCALEEDLRERGSR
jgi:hypothetical protein